MKKLVTAGILLVVMLLFLLSCGCSDSAQGVSTTSVVTNDKTVKPTAVTTAVRTQPVFVEEKLFSGIVLGTLEQNKNRHIESRHRYILIFTDNTKFELETEEDYERQKFFNNGDPTVISSDLLNELLEKDPPFPVTVHLSANKDGLWYITGIEYS